MPFPARGHAVRCLPDGHATTRDSSHAALHHSLRKGRAVVAASACVLLASAGASAAAAQVRPVNFQTFCNTWAYSPAASVHVAVNGTCIDLSNLVQVAGPKPGTWTVQATGRRIGNSLVSFSAFFNSDPFIDFTLSTTNLGTTPTQYATLFSTPIVPGQYGAATLRATLGLTTTASAATVAPTFESPTFITGYGTLGAAGTDFGIGLGTSCAAAALSVTNCPLTTRTTTFPVTQYDNLEAVLAYIQSGAGSTVTISGRLEILAGATPPVTVVPEPSTYVLLGAGLLAIAGLRRRASRRC